MIETKIDEYTVLLSAGTMIVEMVDGLHKATPNLRADVIKAALGGAHADTVRRALRERQPIVFKDVATEVTIYWTPPGVQ